MKISVKDMTPTQERFFNNALELLRRLDRDIMSERIKKGIAAKKLNKK